MFLNPFAIDWAKHGVAWLAMVQVPKANPSQNIHISMLSTKNILCDSWSAHAQ
jgi:hypothetical protein